MPHRGWEKPAFPIRRDRADPARARPLGRCARPRGFESQPHRRSGGIALPERRADGAALAPGIHLMRFQAGATSRTRQVVVVN